MVGSIYAMIALGFQIIYNTTGIINFAQGAMYGLKGFCAAILGGMGNPLGSVVGGLIIGLLEQLSCWFSSVYRDTHALSIVVIMLILRPQGILGE